MGRLMLPSGPHSVVSRTDRQRWGPSAWQASPPLFQLAARHLREHSRGRRDARVPTQAIKGDRWGCNRSRPPACTLALESLEADLGEGDEDPAHPSYDPGVPRLTARKGDSGVRVGERHVPVEDDAVRTKSDRGHPARRGRPRRTTGRGGHAPRVCDVAQRERALDPAEVQVSDGPLGARSAARDSEDASIHPPERKLPSQRGEAAGGARRPRPWTPRFSPGCLWDLSWGFDHDQVEVDVLVLAPRDEGRAHPRGQSDRGH